MGWEGLEGLEVLEGLEGLGGRVGLGKTAELAGELLGVQMSCCLRARLPRQNRRLPYVGRVLLVRRRCLPG